MSDFTINATTRTNTIKTPSKKAMRAGNVLGVIYNKDNNIPITINLHDFKKMSQHLQSNTIIKIVVDQKEEYSVFLRYKDYFLKTNELRHLDFYKINPKQSVKVPIPVELTGLPIGVSKGGVIRKFTNQLLVRCTTETIPDKVVIDISHLDISDFLHLKDIPAPDGAHFLESMDKAVVAINTTSKSRSADKEDSTGEEEAPTEEETEKATSQSS